MTNDPDTKDLFVFLHDASDEELSWIYDHSLFSVYPSHYEGWGLPVAESIAHGVPCIASNTSSIPEIAGDLIPYFSPTSTDECLQAICGLLDDKTLSNAKQKISAYRPTSWDETFAQIRGIIGDTND
ncbi:glycosyltransferase, partial [Candidatus Saccharibacteria bacterium]|nr:glycosyltransferase [Candidatus Saccharibacteria bacterium]